MATRQPGVPGPGQINMIAEGTVLEGTLKATGDVRISGRIVGKLFVEGKVVVTQEGVVDGELSAVSADVAGSVLGEVTVKERLVLKNTAAVDGNVRAARLVVEDGAVFGGKCQMGQGNTGPKGLSNPKVERREVVNGTAPIPIPSHAS
ncbi:MAG TPA: polymer-forming cytoskeletal protein [Rhodothermales bacterium]|nr:polymer-forming cytoskeletal protein [Rhodothermales bacterium]